MRSSLAIASLFAVCAAVLPLSAFGAGVEVEQATKDQLAAAQTTFQAANKLFDAGRFEEAITAFRASYDIVRSPNSVLMVARCQRELGRLGEAFSNYSSALADAERVAKTDPKYEETTRAAREELESLRSQVAFLTITVIGAQTDSEIRIADRRIPVGALTEPIPLKPGEYDVSARSSSGQLITRHVALAEGAKQTLEMDLSASAPEQGAAPEAASTPSDTHGATVSSSGSGSGRTLAYISGGVGVVGMAAFGVFGMMANSEYDSLKSSCPGGTCRPGSQSDIDSGKRDQTIANVGLAVGIVGLGVGITLFAVSGSSDKESGQRAHSEVAILPGRVALRGRF
jgi:hypothetical protein